MSIEITIKYSDSEYMSAIKEKLAVMPNKQLHTYLPTGVLVLVVLVLFHFNAIFSWWGMSLIVLLSIYALPCLFCDICMPKIALAFAKKKKLQDNYHFNINEDQIVRRSEQGMLKVSWKEIISVDFFTQNTFFNLEKGSMFIPNYRLTDAELEKLRLYAART